MGRQLFSSSRRVVCCILMMWLGLIALGPFVHDGGGHDQDCAPVLVVHDASRHNIGAAPAPAHTDEHCAVCHLFCGSRYTESPSVAVNVALRLSLAPRIENDRRLTTSATSTLAARAPPAYS